MPAVGGLDRVDVADDVRDGHVWRGEFFDEARIALDPRDGASVAVALDYLPPVCADGLKRIVVDFGAGDDRNALVEQIGELPNDAALGLPAQAQQDQIVARENCVYDLRDDRLVVADDAGEKSFGPRVVFRSRFARNSSLTVRTRYP